jgi:hypothetical protein
MHAVKHPSCHPPFHHFRRSELRRKSHRAKGAAKTGKLSGQK